MTDNRTDCTWTEEHLVDHLDGALGVDDTARMVEHLASCPACAAAIDDYAAIRAAYRQLPLEEPSERTNQQVLAWARAEGLHPERFEAGLPQARRSRWAPILAVAAALVLLLTIVTQLGDFGEDTDRLYLVEERGLDHYRAGRHEEALEDLDQVYGELLASDWRRPGIDAPRVLWSLAKLRQGRGEDELALLVVQELNGRFGDHPRRLDALVLEARLQEAGGNTAEAIDAWRLAALATGDPAAEYAAQIERLEAVPALPEHLREELGAMGYIGD